MTKLLFIKGTPHTVEMGSLALAEAYLHKLKAKHSSDLTVDTIDLWAEKLPDFDGNKVAAKLNIITGQSQNASQQTAWDEITAIANRFIAADRYLVAVPMWNGGIPYRLKQYIDIIHQPGLLFGLDPVKGYSGLLKNKKATLCLTSGAYAPGVSPAFGVDHHSTYMRSWLNQAGITDIEEIRFQPSLLSANPAGAFAEAKMRAEALAI